MADSVILPPKDYQPANAPGLSAVCVYCGSSESTRPEYLDLASRVGKELARRGLKMVYGGGSIGLMGRAAKACHEAGGDVLGIMPRFLERKEIVLEEVPHRMVDTMHERKAIMFNEADAFLVLPGGIGTLEEAVEMLSWRRLDLHKKPIVFLAEDDFWKPFFELMQHTIDAKLTPPHFLDVLVEARTVEDAFAAIEARVAA
ncbi:MAG: TIGR00730 family Rossman fold protein [Hyphomonadaceae bacterium]